MLPCCRSFYTRRQVSMSLKVSQIVWGAKSTLKRLCQIQGLIYIIHPSRVWSISFNYFANFFLYMQYIYCFCLLRLFVLLFIIRSACCSFLLSYKIILLKYIQQVGLQWSLDDFLWFLVESVARNTNVIDRKSVV